MFYLTLPSNSSADVYPDNTLNNFTVKLPRNIDLDGQWEVGLVEIQYPHSWYNVQEHEAWLLINTSPVDAPHRTYLKAGMYDNPKKLVQLINIMNEDVPNHRKVLFLYDDITKKVTLDIEYGANVELSPMLSHMLGLQHMVYKEGVHEGSHVIDVDQGFYSLYVYCSLVAPRLVGHTQVPLLRIVAIKGKDGMTITKTYENVHYLPVQQKNFDTVEIDIRDDTGRRVPFERGKVVVTLHFRRKPLL